MRGLLNPDNPVMNLITKIAYSAYLNFLWLICSVPIVTIGAFRRNLKQSSIVWLSLCEEKKGEAAGHDVLKNK